MTPYEALCVRLVESAKADRDTAQIRLTRAEALLRDAVSMRATSSGSVPGGDS